MNMCKNDVISEENILSDSSSGTKEREIRIDTNNSYYNFNTQNNLNSNKNTPHNNAENKSATNTVYTNNSNKSNRTSGISPKNDEINLFAHKVVNEATNNKKALDKLALNKLRSRRKSQRMSTMIVNTNLVSIAETFNLFF